MTRGEAQSEESRENLHGHIEHESPVMKHVRKFFAPLGFFQPDDGDVRIPAPKPKKIDPMEETPDEEMRRFERERMGKGPSENNTIG